MLLTVLICLVKLFTHLLRELERSIFYYVRDNLWFVGFYFSPIFPFTLRSRESCSMFLNPEVRLFPESCFEGCITFKLSLFAPSNELI